MLELKYIKTKGTVQEALNNGKLRGQLREKIYQCLNLYKTTDPEHIEYTKYLNLFRSLYYNRKIYELDAISYNAWYRIQQSVTGHLWRMEFHKTNIFTNVYNNLFTEWKRSEAIKLVKDDVIKEYCELHPEFDNHDEEINERSLRT